MYLHVYNVYSIYTCNRNIFYLEIGKYEVRTELFCEGAAVILEVTRVSFGCRLAPSMGGVLGCLPCRMPCVLAVGAVGTAARLWRP